MMFIGMKILMMIELKFEKSLRMVTKP